MIYHADLPLVADARCQCGCGLDITATAALHLQAFAEALARAYAAPVRFVLTSGARCPKHNAEVGGEPDSEHTRGHAVDGYFEFSANGSWKRIDSRDVALFAIRTDLWGGVGWMRYDKTSKIIHLDIRDGKPVTW